MDNVLKKLLESLDIAEREQRKLINGETFLESVTLDNGIIIRLERDASRTEELSYGFYYVMEPIVDSICMILGVEMSDELNDIVLNTDFSIEERIEKIKLLK